MEINNYKIEVPTNYGNYSFFYIIFKSYNNVIPKVAHILRYLHSDFSSVSNGYINIHIRGTLPDPRISIYIDHTIQFNYSQAFLICSGQCK